MAQTVLATDFDFATEGALEMINLMAKHKATVIEFTEFGPAGGNPNVVLGFPDHDRAYGFISEYCPEESEIETWLDSLRPVYV